jgi:hypothetical protein
VLNILVPTVVLQCPRVVAIVGELEPAGMAKHVWVDREWHLGGLPEALDEPVETEPPRVRRRPFGLSHAAMAGCSSMA